MTRRGNKGRLHEGNTRELRPRRGGVAGEAVVVQLTDGATRRVQQPFIDMSEKMQQSWQVAHVCDGEQNRAMSGGGHD
jgi:hypothetical protein